MNSHATSWQCNHRQRGFTLVEIMVALVLSLILTAGVVQIYLTTKQTYRLQESLSRIQENARYALATLSRDIRMAGYWGCGTQSIDPGDVDEDSVLNNKDDYFWNFDVPIEGFEGNDDGTWSPSLDGSVTSPLAGSDVLTLRSVDGGGATVTSDTFAVTTPNDLEQCGIALVTNCETAVVFQITNDPASGSVEDATTGCAPNNAIVVADKVNYVGGDILPISTKTYYVRTGNLSGMPGLWRRVANNAPEELVEGVERLEIRYGVDTDDDGRVESYVTANAVTDWAEVASINLNLLLVSVEENVITEDQTLEIAGTEETFTDRRLRQVFSTTVGVRNRLP